eukprot:scaffold25811_cov38-Tisochrysis_lutea.AAC.1
MVGIEDLDSLCFSLIAEHLNAVDIFNVLGVNSSFGKHFVSSVDIMEVEILDARLKYCKGLQQLMVRGAVNLGSLSTLIGHLPQLQSFVADRLDLDSIPLHSNALKQLRIINSLESLSILDVKKLSTHLSPNALLFLACELGYHDLVTSAIEKGASWRQLYDFTEEEWEFILETQYSPLIYFAYAHKLHNNGWRIKKYVRMGSNINADHTSTSSPLLIATCRKDFGLMELLVELGASVNHPSINNMSPSLASIVMQDTQCLTKLIQLGLDVNKQIVHADAWRLDPLWV